ncbi:MAG: rod shape-determining protein [Pirellulales bacterium]|nr:rod shape-determining protein [Pirellulales bacterium]
MIFAGIDAGSRTLKAALVNATTRRVIASVVADQGVEQNALARQLLGKLLAEAGFDRRDVRAVVATGYGRKLIRDADETITEITCQAAGIAQVAPGARTVIDIGGQDSKLLRLDGTGRVSDFAMNDRCAAGTGRFLEVVAAQLGVRLTELGTLAGASRNPARISSMCVVFAETEIIGLLAQGATLEDLAAGVQAAIAARLAAMAGGQVTPPIVLTGGVALIPGMDAALGAAFSHPVAIAPEPQLTCAVGAALLAARSRR